MDCNRREESKPELQTYWSWEHGKSILAWCNLVPSQEHQPSETLEFFQSRIFIASSFLWSFPEPDLAINLQAGFGFWCLCEMFQHLLPGTHPFSPWCEGLWVQGAALLEGLQCLGTTGEPPSSWASLNRWDILSWQCSTAHQQLRVWSKAASGPGEGSVRSCFGV